jgi:O-antigen chain-terminating methyltransferase
VVTAFHLFPRCQLDYLLALMREVARVLAPGGLIAMEAPQPSNPIVSSNNFWIDPGHIRLMPHQLMEFIFQYFGLRVIWHAHLNEHHAYGAQDYGFVAKRA